MNSYLKMGVALLALAVSAAANAAVDAEEAKKLGTSLTPFGAEQANEEGTIPAWTGGLTTAPASYDPGKPGVLTNPFSDEKPQFSINQSNVAEYEDKLAAGVVAMLRKYPTMRVDVYPTHRTAAYPQEVLDNTVANATQCEHVAAEETIRNCAAGLPFPIPQNGKEVLWNHFTPYQGPGWTAKVTTNVVDAGGRLTLMGLNDTFAKVPYYLPREGDASVLMRWRWDTTGPARMAGEKILLNYPMKLSTPVESYQYLAGQRRVKQSPDLVYDTPNPQSAGSSGMDDMYGFWGRMDRFDIQLVGKQEMYIPYNNFEVFDPSCPAETLLTPQHPNPDCVRWELHRVWVVEGTLKDGVRHIYNKRRFYLDEDTFNAGIYDNYDGTGNVYRTSQQWSIPLYHEDSFGQWGQVFSTYDLQTGVYGFFGHPNVQLGGHGPLPEILSDREFTPSSLSGRGVR